MIDVLYIALEFGPVQTTGAFRSIDFVHHLPEFGIRPRVLTVKPEEGLRIFSAIRNDGLLESLPSTVSIAHLTDAQPIDPLSETRLAGFIRLFTNLDDTFFKRFRDSLRVCLRNEVLEGKRYAAVIATAPPFGAARLGKDAAVCLKCPLILDMRDSWVEFGYAPSTTWIHHLAKRRDEVAAFRSASTIVTVTERLANVFRASHRGIPASKFKVIPNGFRGSEFEYENVSASAESGYFHVAYVGSFYYSPRRPRSVWSPHRLMQYSLKKEDWSYRGPQYFFSAWRELLRRAPQIGERIRFHHIGTTPRFLMPMAAEYGLDAFCKTWGQVPKQQVQNILKGMNALLATSMKRDDGGDYCLASKTFDYVQAKKPVVAFVCEGSQRDFLERAGIAVLCEPDDTRESAERLRKLVDEGASLRLNAEYINQFHRREAARRMAEVVFQLTGRGRGGGEVSSGATLPYI